MPLRPKRRGPEVRLHLAALWLDRAHDQHPDLSLIAGYDLPGFDEVWEDVAELAAKGPRYIRALARAIEAHDGADASGLERKALGVLAGDVVVARGEELGRSDLAAMGFDPPAEYRRFRLELDSLTELPHDLVGVP